MKLLNMCDRFFWGIFQLLLGEDESEQGQYYLLFLCNHGNYCKCKQNVTVHGHGAPEVFYLELIACQLSSGSGGGGARGPPSLKFLDPLLQLVSPI